MKHALSSSRLAIGFAFVLCLVPMLASAQVPPRFYWKTLSGANAFPLIYLSVSGNSNPLDPAHVVSDIEFEAEVFTAGYAKVFTLFDRSATVAVLETMGRVTADARLGGLGAIEQTTGFGDPLTEFTIGLLGPPPIKNLPDLLRYEPGFSLDFLVDLVLPIGEYDREAAVNLGQNRWYGRIGFPVVWQLSRWVPGKRTTLELLPSLWLYGDNDDFQGATLETDPMFQVEGHLTRDFGESFWASLDATLMTGGKSTIQGHAGESLNNLGMGFTMGYQLSENLQLTAGYLASIDDGAPTDLRMDVFKVSLVYGWHKIIEGVGRLGSAE